MTQDRHQTGACWHMITISRKFAPARRILQQALRQSYTMVTALSAQVNPSPVIVLGHQKSGTTAIAALLAARTGLSVTLDIPGLHEPVQSQIHAQQLPFDAFLHRNRVEFSRDIIKEPCLSFLYPEIQRTIPQARVVMIVRDPRDNLRSILIRLNLPGDAQDIGDMLASLIPAWRIIFDPRWLHLQGDTYIEVLAARWNRCVDILLHHRQEMLLVQYEDFLKDKLGEIDRLSRHLGIRGTADISDKVDIQYQPRGNHSVTWEEFFGRDNLSQIEKICGSRMQYFGYLPSLLG